MIHPRLMAALLGLLLALPTLRLTAQETGWPVETRCVGEPTAPPEGWTFEGVIIATGWAGLHGISANFRTPYIIQFIDFSKTGASELSPDGRWWAITEETDNAAQLHEAGPILVQVHSITVYSTSDYGLFYRIPWEANYVIEPIMGSGSHWFEQQVRWWDNDHLVYVQKGSRGVWDEASRLELVNPFTGQEESLPTTWQDKTHILLPRKLYSLSPDHSRFAFQAMISPTYTLIDLEKNTVLSPDMEKSAALWVGSPVWKPDSSQFLNRYQFKGEDNYVTVLNSRDGETVDTVFTNNKDERIFLRYPIENAWSSDGRYFVLYAFTTALQDRLYLADTQERKITDTCLNMTEDDSLAWSPDGTMLTFTAPIGNNHPVIVLDIKNWQAYMVAYHNGRIIGWRED